jgi:hypothetical protein
MDLDAIGPLEARLLALERRNARIGDDLETLRRLEVALWQEIWDSWGDVHGRVMTPAPTPTPTPTCTATVSGTLKGCNNIVLSGESVVIHDHGSGTVLTTITTSGGSISGTLSITSPSETVDVDTMVSGFNSTSMLKTFSCGSNGLGTITLTADASHVCFTGCAYPVSTSITVTSNLYGAFTATWNSGSSSWIASVTVNYPGRTGPNCTAVNNIPITWSLTNGGTCSEHYVSPAGVGGCPGTTGTGNNHTGTLTSSACPPSFSRTYTMVSLTNYSGGAHTLTWTDP